MKKLMILSCIFLSLSMAAQSVKWHTFEEAVALSKKEPRKILVDVYTDWCGYCKVMDKNTFANPIIAEYMNATYYPVKLDAEQKDDITFNNQTYKFIAQGQRGYHELAAALLKNQMSYPSVVFLDEKVSIFHIQKGYVKAKPFDEIIKYIGGSHYIGTPYDEWIKTYQSPIKTN